MHKSGMQASGARAAERLASAIPLVPCCFRYWAQTVCKQRGPATLLSSARQALKADQKGEASGNHSRTKMTGWLGEITNSGRLSGGEGEKLLSMAPRDAVGMNGQNWREKLVPPPPEVAPDIQRKGCVARWARSPTQAIFKSGWITVMASPYNKPVLIQLLPCDWKQGGGRKRQRMDNDLIVRLILYITPPDEHTWWRPSFPQH